MILLKCHKGQSRFVDRELKRVTRASQEPKEPRDPSQVCGSVLADSDSLRLDSETEGQTNFSLNLSQIRTDRCDLSPKCCISHSSPTLVSLLWGHTKGLDVAWMWLHVTQ